MTQDASEAEAKITLRVAVLRSLQLTPIRFSHRQANAFRRR
jgi:hypothetical protein